MRNEGVPAGKQRPGDPGDGQQALRYFAAPERGSEFDTRHSVMTEDMIRQIGTRRDGTGYAFILRNGLSPVVGRTPVIWRDRSASRMARRASPPGTVIDATADPARAALPAVMADAPQGVTTSSAAPVLDSPISGQVEDDTSAGRKWQAWDQTGPPQ